MLNKIVFMLACIVVLQTMAFAWSECKTQFYLDVPIQVIDNGSINAPGVNVSMTYQKRANFFTPGPEYVTTDPVLTDSNGMAVFKIKNDVPNSKYLDCNLIVHVSYLNFTKNYTFNLGTFYGKYIINLPAKRVIVNMLDSSGRPISGKMVLYPSTEFLLNNSASVLLPFGSTPGYIVFEGHRQGITLNTDASTPNYANAVFRTYDVEVSVSDDTGSPMAFSIQVGEGEPVNAVQTVTVRVVDNPASIKVSARGRETYRQINPEKDSNISIYYDIHAPEISNINIVPEESGQASILYTVSDKGEFSSGIRETGVYVDDVYYSASLKYSSAKAAVLKSGIFSFRVVATDNDGNKAEVSADYVAGEKPAPANGNATASEDSAPAAQDGEWNNLIIIIAVVAILLMAVFLYIKSNYLAS